MSGRWRVALCAVALLGVVPLATAASSAADAADSGMEVSADGIAWSSGIESPLFSSFGLLVPGDVRSASIWVRNSSSEPAVLRISGRSAFASSAVFGDAVSVSASGTGLAGTPHTLNSIGSCMQLMPDGALGVGETRVIDIQVAFADVGGTDATTDTAQADIRASLSARDDAGLSATSCPEGITMPLLPPRAGAESAGAPPESGEPQAEGTTTGLPNGVLAFTGGWFYPSIMCATVALGSGLILVAATRRRRRGDS